MDRIARRCASGVWPAAWFAGPHCGQLQRHDGEPHCSAPTPAQRAGVIALAERTHAVRPLPSPPPGTPALAYREDPAAARRFARTWAAAAGLTEPGLTDLIIAVGELAANTLRHTAGPGTIRLWAEPGEVICEVSDTGYIRDDLAGRRCPPADAGRGQGLWVVHQVCDRVEMRTGPGGTVFRLHLAL
jgi:anti-sigma regulatory factor (Ser/Thr protein kinase)